MSAPVSAPSRLLGVQSPDRTGDGGQRRESPSDYEQSGQPVHIALSDRLPRGREILENLRQRRQLDGRRGGQYAGGLCP